MELVVEGAASSDHGGWFAWVVVRRVWSMLELHT